MKVLVILDIHSNRIDFKEKNEAFLIQNSM